jgi:tripartite-type tricarboxylate transporter receptor subunit TctC
MNRFTASLAALLLSAAQLAHAQDYPSRPIKLIVPFGPATTTDLTARLYGEALAKELHQPVVIENRAGAGGTIGTEAGAKARPDGYTLLFGTSGTWSVNPFLYQASTVDPVRDLKVVSLFGNAPMMLVTRANSPINTIDDLLKAARQNPGKLTYASAGSGTTGHLAAELIKSMGKVRIEHVPFKDGTQGLTSVIAGDVDFMFYHPIALKPHLESGRLKPIGVTSMRRSVFAPAVPTISESGLPGFEVVSAGGVAVPAATPAPVVARLMEASNRLMATPEMKAKIIQSGLEPSDTSPEILAAFLKADTEKWKKLVVESGARAD